jgi:uncharacterized protein (DUF58 family)
MKTPMETSTPPTTPPVSDETAAAPTGEATRRRGAQMTGLLSNEVLHRVERFKLNPLRRLTNRSRGEHLRGKGGASTEFADYRDYAAGDDIRFVDWNIFARLNRPYLKLYEHEEEMHVVLLIDGSNSMMFENKLHRARQLAAAFGVMGLMNLERVSAYVFNERENEMSSLRPCSGRQSMHKLFGYLEKVEGGGDAPLEYGVEKMLQRHRGRGIAILLSDFLTYGDLPRAFNLLFSAGLEIFAVQILGQSELEPEVVGDLRMVDSETGNVLDVSSAGNLLSMYHDYREAFSRKLEALARQRMGRFITVGSDEDLRFLLMDVFRRQGWVL